MKGKGGGEGEQGEEGGRDFDCSMRNGSRDRNCVTFTVCCCGRTDGRRDGPPPALPLNEMPRGTRNAAGASAFGVLFLHLCPRQAECHFLIMLMLSLILSKR